MHQIPALLSRGSASCLTVLDFVGNNVVLSTALSKLSYFRNRFSLSLVNGVGNVELGSATVRFRQPCFK